MKNLVLKHILPSALVMGSLLFAGPVYSQDIELKQDRPERYTVVSGDTLWDISGRFLQDPWRWKEVWRGNSQIANPDLIYPGDVIRLVFVDGQPRLTTERNGVSSEQSQTSQPPTEKPEPKTVTSAPSGPKKLKTVKLSPKIYSTPIKDAIPAIPLEKINNFLSGNRIVEIGTLEQAPHVVAGQEQRVILGAGDILYARGSFKNTISSYGIYRGGQQYVDPETKQVLGIQALDVGAANIRALDGDIATFDITRSTGEIRVGDRLLSSEEREITSTFLPTPPENAVEGLIMTVERGISQVGKLDIVALNLGKNQGLEQGHLLAIFKRGSTIKDRNAQKKTPKKVSLPEERAGLVLVFQVFDKMSLGIILDADRGISVKDIVRNP